MATRLILPDYIVGNFIPPKACKRCGRSDVSFKLLFPQLKWHKTDIELVYPLRCPCGGSGCVRIKLSTLLFGYILATVALVDVANRRRSKTTMIVSPSNTDFMADMFGKFDRLMMDTCPATTPPLSNSEQQPLGNNDAERIKFGFDEDEWKVFLRRLGLDGPATEDSDS